MTKDCNWSFIIVDETKNFLHFRHGVANYPDWFHSKKYIASLFLMYIFYESWVTFHKPRVTLLLNNWNWSNWLLRESSSLPYPMRFLNSLSFRLNTFRAPSDCTYLHRDPSQRWISATVPSPFQVIQRCPLVSPAILLICHAACPAATSEKLLPSLSSAFNSRRGGITRAPLSRLIEYFPCLRTSDENHRAKCHSHELTAFMHAFPRRLFFTPRRRWRENSYFDKSSLSFSLSLSHPLRPLHFIYFCSDFSSWFPVSRAIESCRRISPLEGVRC